MSFNTADSILKVALQAFEAILKLEQEIEWLGKELEQTGDEKLLESYTDKLHQLEMADGYTIHHRTAEVLQGLGFSPSDLDRPTRSLVGGGECEFC